MYVEFWARPDKIFELHQVHVEDLAFCTTEDQANKVFDRASCDVPEIWRGHVWSESIRWVGSGIARGRRQTNGYEPFAPFATVTRSEEERAKDEQKDLEAGVNLDKAHKVASKYAGRTYPVYNR
jgi:hypothetical protein